MESPSQTGAESPPPPVGPGLSVQDSRVEYIKKTLLMLRDKTNDLLQRYQDAGIKWHLLPFVARASHHNDQMWIDILDEVSSVIPETGSLAECVTETFDKLVSFIIDAQRAFDRGDEHLAAAQVFVDGASYEAKKMEQRIAATEAAVADFIAVRNALDEWDLLGMPEVMLDVKLACFEDWLLALSEAEKGWIAMKKS
jgi:hypothetical protein